MYFYVMKEFGDAGWRYLRLIEEDGKEIVSWRAEPTRSFDGGVARELAERFKAEVVEVSLG